jgi:hypothetical protein
MIYNKFKVHFSLTINKIYIFEKIAKNISINIREINNIINIFIINKRIKNYFLDIL